MISLLYLLLLMPFQIHVMPAAIKQTLKLMFPTSRNQIVIKQTLTTKLAIIGGGPSGLSAAIGAGKAGNLKPIVIECTIMEGAVHKAGEITNYPGFPLKITGPEIIENMREQAKNLGVTLLPEEKIIECNFNTRPFILKTNNGTQINCDSVIIATGTNPKKLSILGEDKFIGKGVSYCSKCEGPLLKNKKIVIVGNDHSALRELKVLLNFTHDITLISTKSEFTAPQMLLNYLQTPNLKIVKNAKPKEIMGDQNVTGIKIQKDDGEMEVFPADGIFVTLGWKPSTDMFKGILKLNSKDEIIVDPETFETSVKGVFASGECSNMAKHQMPHAAGNGYSAYLNAEIYLNNLA